MKNNSENHIEGRNAVLEAFRSGQTVDKVFMQKDLHDGMIMTIAREARKAGTILSYVPKERLNQMSETGRHQGVIAFVASYNYASVKDILKFLLHFSDIFFGLCHLSCSPSICLRHCSARPDSD